MSEEKRRWETRISNNRWQNPTNSVMESRKLGRGWLWTEFLAEIFFSLRKNRQSLMKILISRRFFSADRIDRGRSQEESVIVSLILRRFSEREAEIEAIALQPNRCFVKLLGPHVGRHR